MSGSLLIISMLLLLGAQTITATDTWSRKLLKKKNQASASSAALSGLASNYLYTGDGTEYSDSLSSDGASGFMCSYPFVSPWVQDYFVAINKDQWAQGTNCGRCVKVSCVDPKCDGQPDVVAYIVDQCATCSSGDLDFGIVPWTDLSGMTPDRVQIAWNFTSCHDYITDTIRFDAKDGSNKYWQAFYFSNVRYRPAAVSLNGIALEQDTTNYWANDGQAPSAPYVFTLTSYGGSQLTFEVDNLFKSQDTGVQFQNYYKGAATNKINPKIALAAEEGA